MNDDDEHDVRTVDPRRVQRSIAAAMFGSAVAIAVAVATLLPALARAGCEVQSVEMPVRMVGSRAVAVVEINGTPTPLTVDSGAFFSFLTDAAAAQLQLPLKRNPTLRVQGITGRVDVRTTVVEKLKLVNGEVGQVEFVVGGNEPGAGTMGLMGRNILSFTDMEYDLAHGVIRFQYPNDDCKEANLAYWAGSEPVSEIDLLRDYRSKAASIRTEVKLNGKALVALFDTGATTVVTARGAARAGIADADRKPAGTIYGGGRGRAEQWTASFDRFEIGRETISDTRLPIGDFEIDGAEVLLGIDFFLSHRIYVSKQQSRMFFTYNGGPVFARAQGKTASGGAAPAPDAEQPTTADALARRGAASASRREYDSALADFDRACAMDPASAPCFAQRATVHVALKHPVKALEDFDHALTLDPSQIDARWGRAALRLARKDRDGAKADLDALDRTLAPQAQMRLPVARLYLSLEQPALALAQLNQWLTAHPNDIMRPGAQNSRCWARVLLGIELRQALDDCDEAVDGDSKNAAFLASRGWVHLRMAKYTKALADFDRSIESAPTNAMSLYGRAQARMRLGEDAAGNADLAAARKAVPDIDARMAHLGLVPEASPKPSTDAR